MLTFFAIPNCWWWGKAIEDYRWSLYGGIILLVAVIASRLSQGKNTQRDGRREIRWVHWFAIGILANATLVHVFLADNAPLSAGPYGLLVKFVILFILIVAAMRTTEDFRIVLFVIVIGATYIGYEATINDRGEITGSRLEGIGAPGANQANQLASLMVTILPFAGALCFMGRRWQKMAMLVSVPFILNVVLLCNSRGVFLGALVGAFVFLIASPANVRKQAAALLGLAALATWLLLGDPRIAERFLTTFASAEERDESAAGRFLLWKAGLNMAGDYPFGAGGDAFKVVHGPRYMEKIGMYGHSPAVHNGFINEMCEWGIQGLALRLAFMTAAGWCVFRTIKACRNQHEVEGMLTGAALASSMAAFLVTCVFGDRLDNEWGYWLAALAVGFARFYDIPPETLHGRSVSDAEETSEFDDEDIPVDFAEDEASRPEAIMH